MARYNNINAELARAGVSTKELADFMGLSSQTVYGKLNGKITVTERDMRNVQNFFVEKTGGKFSFEYLFECKD